MNLLQKLFQAVLANVSSFATINWPLVVGVATSVILHKLVKASLNLILLVLFIALVLSLASNMGILPQLKEIFQGVMNFVQK